MSLDPEAEFLLPGTTTGNILRPPPSETGSTTANHNSTKPPTVNQNQLPASATELLQLLSQNTILIQLLEMSDLAQTVLDRANEVTVLAPSNNAFNRLSPAILAFLQREENSDVLREILLYHVISRDSNLAGEPSPPVIQIDSILIPPTVQNQLAGVVNQVSQAVNQVTVPTAGPPPAPPPNVSGVYGQVPKWMSRSKATNNFA